MPDLMKHLIYWTFYCMIVSVQFKGYFFCFFTYLTDKQRNNVQWHCYYTQFELINRDTPNRL